MLFPVIPPSIGRALRSDTIILQMVMFVKWRNSSGSTLLQPDGSSTSGGLQYLLNREKSRYS